MKNKNKIPESNPHFWETHYQEGETGWDVGGPTPVFSQLVELLKPGKLCIIGCGRGYDAILFAQYGFRVTAVDFAPSAIRSVQKLAQEAKLSVQALERDLFTLSQDFEGEFDYVLEQTCFCAIPVHRRVEYEQLVWTILRPKGQLIGLWYPLDKKLEEGGPPWGVEETTLKQLFQDRWHILQDEYPTLSIPRRQGREKLIIFQKRSLG